MSMSRVPLFSWSALVAALGLVLVLPVVVGVAHLPLRRLPLHARTRCSAATPASARLDRLRLHPAGRRCLFALPAVGFVAELIPVDVPQAPADARRRARRPRPRRRRRARRGHPAGRHDVPGAAAADARPLRRQARRPRRRSPCFVLLPLLGVVVVLAIGAARRQAGSKAAPRPSHHAAVRASRFFGVQLIARRHARRRARRRSTTSACRARCSRRARRRTSATAPCSPGSARSPTGRPSWTGRTLPDEAGRRPRPARRRWPPRSPRCPYFIAGFADQPADAGVVRLRRPEELWNVLVAAGHALMVLVVLGLRRPRAAGRRGRRRPSAGDDPWDGQTLEWATSSPAPADNYADEPTVMSPEPVLDLKPATDGSGRTA